jgi:hypothetical protein
MLLQIACINSIIDHMSIFWMRFQCELKVIERKNRKKKIAKSRKIFKVV